MVLLVLNDEIINNSMDIIIRINRLQRVNCSGRGKTNVNFDFVDYKKCSIIQPFKPLQETLCFEDYLTSLPHQLTLSKLKESKDERYMTFLKNWTIHSKCSVHWSYGNLPGGFRLTIYSSIINIIIILIEILVVVVDIFNV